MGFIVVDSVLPLYLLYGSLLGKVGQVMGAGIYCTSK